MWHRSHRPRTPSGPSMASADDYISSGRLHVRKFKQRARHKRPLTRFRSGLREHARLCLAWPTQHHTPLPPSEWPGTRRPVDANHILPRQHAALAEARTRPTSRVPTVAFLRAVYANVRICPAWSWTCSAITWPRMYVELFRPLRHLQGLAPEIWFGDPTLPACQPPAIYSYPAPAHHNHRGTPCNHAPAANIGRRGKTPYPPFNNKRPFHRTHRDQRSQTATSTPPCFLAVHAAAVHCTTCG